MRIIAGKLHGRKLSVPAGRKVRPTGDRMKESLFSALGDACSGATVLDLFAGSGALGLEALSRGAASVTFVEKSRTAIRSLMENVRLLGVETDCSVICVDVLPFLANLKKDEDFDLVFADPPFASGFAKKVFSWWLEHHCKGSILVLECPENIITFPGNIPVRRLKTARFGESTYSIYLAE